ncbi:MAG: hypothetical protein ACW98Y_17430 [Candidatus Thorarchaeota archaeon]
MYRYTGEEIQGYIRCSILFIFIGIILIILPLVGVEITPLSFTGSSLLDVFILVIFLTGIAFLFVAILSYFYWLHIARKMMNTR